MNSQRNIVFFLTLLAVAVATMCYCLSTDKQTDNLSVWSPKQRSYTPSVENTTIYANYSTNYLGISQQHRISREAMQSPQRSYTPHSLYQHSSAMTASSCVAVPLQLSTVNHTTNYRPSSVSEPAANLLLPSLPRRSIVAATNAPASYKGIASTAQETDAVVRCVPVIGGSTESVWQQWLDEYNATGATDMSGLEAWWYSKYGDGYTPDIYTDFAKWAVPLNDSLDFCLLLLLAYFVVKQTKNKTTTHLHRRKNIPPYNQSQHNCVPDSHYQTIT